MGQLDFAEAGLERFDLPGTCRQLPGFGNPPDRLAIGLVLFAVHFSGGQLEIDGIDFGGKLLFAFFAQLEPKGSRAISSALLCQGFRRRQGFGGQDGGML